MPWSVLVLPLIGGYLFVNFYVVTRYYTKTHSGQRLLFNAAAVGVALVIPARIVVELCNRYAPAIGNWWRAYMPIPFSGTAWLSLIIGILLLVVLNKFTDKDWAMRWVVGRPDSNSLDRLLYDVQERFRTLQIQVTLASGKVYVGWLREKRLIGREGDSAYLEVIPSVSGYCDPVNHKITFTSNYLPLYKSLPANDPDSILKFVKVIPLFRMTRVSIFDPASYEDFAENASPPPGGG